MNLDRYCAGLLAEGIAPGWTLLAGRGGRIGLNRVYGHQSREPDERPLLPGTVYDLASLTKPLVTAMLLLMLLERGEVALSDRLDRYLPAYPHPLSLESLLVHTSGLPAWAPLYLLDGDYLTALRGVSPRRPAGKRVEYSCLGYILLTLVLERITGRPLAELAREWLFAPLGLTRTWFHVPRQWLAEVAPTERGNQYERRLAAAGPWGQAAASFPWRCGVIRGETHDGNSYYRGGTAGNAGLFADAPGVFRLACEAFPETTTLLRPDTAALFWRNLTPRRRSPRSAGFAVLDPRPSTWATEVGHTGFTGTAVYLRREPAEVVVLLSNRVHPEVRPVDMRRVRRRLAVLVRRELERP